MFANFNNKMKLQVQEQIANDLNSKSQKYDQEQQRLADEARKLAEAEEAKKPPKKEKKSKKKVEKPPTPE